MASGNEFKITDETRAQLAEIFQVQYDLVQDNAQKLFIFDKGNYAEIKEYYNKISYTENNIVYSHDSKPIMSVFAFTGKRALKIEKCLNRANLKTVGVRVFKDSVIPMHVDPNYHSIGRENPIYFIVVSATDDSMIYFSNRKDGTKQVAIPGLSQFKMYPTEIEHGGFAAGQDMDMIQIMVGPIE